ncbi:MAG: alpha/beta hydrolase-fold protein [Bacteroidota bacterium]
MRIFIFAFLPCFFLLPASVWSQEYVTQLDSLYSVHLKEQRQIQVIFPEKYNPNLKDCYDVFYVLDGEWNTSLSETVLHFLGYGQFIPTNMMIVSIPNLYEDDVNMRDRDFTPTQVKNRAVSGGANDFLLFLKEELVPFISEKYLTDSENSVLYGTSLGGLFAIYTYLHEPALFKSYLTVEPALHWDNEYLNKVASRKLPDITETGSTLWISSRNGKDFKEMGIAKFESLLSKKAPKELHWKVATYPNETHFSAIWKGIYDGLKFTYTKGSDEKIVNRANTSTELEQYGLF